jgi:DNA-binding transcriptional ArsR family regulator
VSLAAVKALHALEETDETSVKDLAERLRLSLPAARSTRRCAAPA